LDSGIQAIATVHVELAMLLLLLLLLLSPAGAASVGEPPAGQLGPLRLERGFHLLTRLACSTTQHRAARASNHNDKERKPGVVPACWRILSGAFASSRNFASNMTGVCIVYSLSAIATHAHRLWHAVIATPS
jgi:hypothetical protein